MNSIQLRNLEFELAYLTALTKEGLKPLSRWERHFDGATEENLRSVGLKTWVVDRTVRSGPRLRELLFSNSEQILNVYAARFAGAPVDQDPDAVRLEGRLFGYPACCVESYIARGYAKNSLRRRDQRILFHWACPHCAVTPLLLPRYRQVYRSCCAALPGSATPCLPDRPVRTWRRRRTAMAAAVTALGILASAMPSAAADPLDPHVTAFSLGDDPDHDFLTSAEERLLGLNPDRSDEDTNAVPDGVDLARTVAGEIAGLPTEPSSNRIYRLDIRMRGIERCEICGTTVNMGYLTVNNPQAHLSVEISYVALHALEHDSFSFSGDIHGMGRTDVKPVLDALFKPEIRLSSDEHQVRLRWITRKGHHYQVFTASDLAGPWTGGPVFEGDGTESAYTEAKPPGAGKGFYKVAVW